MQVPTLETSRLLIRSLTMDDLDAVHHLLDSDPGEAGASDSSTREERGRWLHWTCLSYDELARLHQPPYGDRALVLKETRQLVGVCGYVPCLDAFPQLPVFGGSVAPSLRGMVSAEVGLHWTVAPSHRRQGYATEAARALIDYGFSHLALMRLIATTEYANHASMAVMRKAGMAIVENPYAEPPWLQVVGTILHPRRAEVVEPQAAG